MNNPTPNTAPKTSRPINADPKTNIAKKYADRVRRGKTAKDKANKK